MLIAKPTANGHGHVALANWWPSVALDTRLAHDLSLGCGKLLRCKPLDSLCFRCFIIFRETSNHVLLRNCIDGGLVEVGRWLPLLVVVIFLLAVFLVAVTLHLRT